MQARLQTFVKVGLLALVALMPFHAFLTIFLGHLFGHQALWQAWKEVLILVMSLVVSLLIYSRPALLKQLSTPVNLAALVYAIIALLVSLISGIHNSTAFWFGVKTDLVFILLFFIAQIAGTRRLKIALAIILIVTATTVSILALIQTRLSPNFLTYFGYNETTIRPLQLVDPAVKSIRAFATLGGPNQLGAFLILPICILISLIIRRFKLSYLAGLITMTLALTVTYSRSAWIGAFVGTIIVVAFTFKKRGVLTAVTLTFAGLLLLAITLPRLSQLGKLQYFVLHSNAGQTSVKTSNPLHIEALKNGLSSTEAHPFGQGLGAAGPASTHGTTGFIPENYYLQIAIESGLLGLFAFITFQILVAISLFQLRHSVGLATPLLAALIGISLVNILLHGWADSTLAYVYWILAGVVIGYKDHVNPNQV